MRSYIPTEVFHLRHLEEDEEKALEYFKFGAIVSSESKCQPLTFTNARVFNVNRFLQHCKNFFKDLIQILENPLYSVQYFHRSMG